MNPDPARNVKQDLQEYKDKQSGGNKPALTYGSVWKHVKSQKMYMIITVANEEATKLDYPVTVVYEALDGEPKGVWAKTLDRWYESMVPA